MKNSKLINIFTDGNIVIPLFLLKNYEELGLKLEEFIYLMYLNSLGNKFLFDPNKFKDDLNMNLGDIMNYTSILTSKGFIQVDVLKDNNKLMEEVVILDNFYDKISLLIMDREVNEKKDDSDIFSMIEKEFGRTLSPIESETINNWLENNISTELIKEAVKEASYSGVSNLRYIDKVLYAWEKDGIKTAEDVEKRRRERKKKTDSSTNSDIDMDIVDWDWFDEDE